MDKKSWLDLFDERQQKEIGLSRIYTEKYGHGTDGHNAKLIITKMSHLLDSIQETVQRATLNETEILKKVADILGIL